MKKIVLFSLVSVIILLISGCAEEIELDEIEGEVDEIKEESTVEDLRDETVEEPEEESYKIEKEEEQLEELEEVVEEDIVIRLIQNGKIVRDILTSEKGKFKFGNLSEGNYGLLFIKGNKVYIYNDDKTQGKWYVNDSVQLKNIEFLNVKKDNGSLEIFFDFNEEKSDYLYRILKVDYHLALNSYRTYAHTKDSKAVKRMVGWWAIEIPENKTVFEMIYEFENDVKGVEKARPFIIHHPTFNETIPEKEFNYTNCVENPPEGEYAQGAILVNFIQDVTKEQVDELLSSYNLSSSDIRFPGRMDYRVDFLGDEEGFLNYLKERGFTRRDNRNPIYFLLSSNNSINCREASKIFYSYSGVVIDRVICMGHVGGVVEVPESEENEWVCELQKSNIVSNAHLNFIVHVGI